MRRSPGPAALAVIVAAPLLLPAAGAAQERVFRAPLPTQLRQDTLPSATRLAVGGVLGGAAGMVGLGFLGLQAAGGGWAALSGMALGGLVGEMAGVAVGVHLADESRGSFWADLGVSALAGSTALGAVALIEGASEGQGTPWGVVGLGVALQVGLTVHTELSTR